MRGHVFKLVSLIKAFDFKRPLRSKTRTTTCTGFPQY